jgi:hypothetical protein
VQPSWAKTSSTNGTPASTAYKDEQNMISAWRAQS